MLIASASDTDDTAALGVRAAVSCPASVVRTRGPAVPQPSMSVPTTAKSASKSMSIERLSEVRTDAS